jgi:hypothetical protein
VLLNIKVKNIKTLLSPSKKEKEKVRSLDIFLNLPWLQRERISQYWDRASVDTRGETSVRRYELELIFGILPKKVKP